MNRLIFAGIALIGCSGCNTVAGFGKDLQTIGGVMAGTAEGVQNGTAQPSADRVCTRDDKGRMPSGC